MAPSEDNLGFKCAVITGGGGGIGKVMAKHFISKGKKVIIAGRTESKLQETAKEIGAVDYYVLDTGKIEQIPDFVRRVTKEHPDLDCLVNNAGVQRPLEILKDDDFLSKADQEIDINIRGPMHLALGLLPHLQTKESALIINVSSVLGFIPFSIINPVYNGTKAWLHFWSMNLRTQLKNGGSKVRVVEIAPPTVATDLHRERSDPDDNKKANNPDALSVDEFMEEVASKLEDGVETIGPGMAGEVIGRCKGVEIGPLEVPCNSTLLATRDESTDLDTIWTHEYAKKRHEGIDEDGVEVNRDGITGLNTNSLKAYA
ncbi:short-chain dehydrogenase [Colletotrichum scovillei]|uniref:Short-chain dehydrogenase n=1 Tax=Colletotrichum scovillei TaxID=1209932 RepID=A0A9P7QVP7_9PEZI|nr:short-chain dehydrogenase [Colletotrichum scovillei]KAG7042331.1 short-chain dehydrogenase [Colletotrichum scovillei]KAG7062365.1 short-chain dehydrogenase [Colletotrichum scovillei]